MKLNKIGVILMGCLLLAGGSIQAQSVEDRALQELRADSSARTRFVTRATMYGVGYTNVYDTYLSPQEYKGIDFRISRESMRMTKWMNGNISLQSFFQADLGYTHNRVDNNNTFSGLANWNYGLHYNFPITSNFKLLAGGLIDLNGGTGTRLYQSGCIRNGNMGFTDQKLSHQSALSGQSSFCRRYVLPELRTIVLRDIYAGQLGRSDKLHLPAQSAIPAANANC